MIPVMPRALRGEMIDPSIYTGNLEPDRVHGFASENLPQLAAAIALANAVNARDAIASAKWRAWWISRLAWERTNFMGHEMAGRTYPSWHFMPKRMVLELAIRQGWEDLATECYAWMVAFLALTALSSGKRPGRSITDHRIANAGVIVGDGEEVAWSGRYCAWSGDRADSRMSDDDARKNGVPAGTWCDWLSVSSPTLWLDLALGYSVGDCQERSLNRECIPWLLETDHFRLTEALLAKRYQPALELLRDWRPQVPIRVVQAEEGVWTLSPVGRNSSTPHAYAVAQWHDTGVVKGLYADPGWRDAGGKDWIVSGTAYVDGNVALASRSDGKYGSPHHLTLPGGARFLDMTWGPDGVSIVFPTGAQPTTPSVDPVPETRGDDAPELSEIEPGKWLLLWRGRAKVLDWPADDGRTMVICDQHGDPT